LRKARSKPHLFRILNGEALVVFSGCLRVEFENVAFPQQALSRLPLAKKKRVRQLFSCLFLLRGIASERSCA
jgi:hypothetical protein